MTSPRPVTVATAGKWEMETYFVETWGCQMNVLDSQHMEGMLQHLGLSCAAAADHADVVILNTCSVREKAVQKVLSRLGELHRSRLATGMPRVVGLCGCVAEQEGEGLLKRSRSLSFVLGPGKIGHLPHAIAAATHGERTSTTGFSEIRDYDSHLIRRAATGRHYVTAIHGCDQYCTFCVVPYTRGREASRPLRDIVSEVTGLAAAGAVEITVLGQTVNAYRCPETSAGFSELLEALTAIPGPRWIQFLTSHPRHFDSNLVGILGRLPRLGTYLHIPFQAGSNRILAAMHRRYTREEYLDLVQRIRSARPETVLSTDVIVGFPGETEQDFEETLELVERVRFGQLFGFFYSPRPRTPAARYPGRVTREIGGKRLERLFELQAGIQLASHQALIGTRREILVDGPARKGADLWQGRGADNRVVNVPAWEGIRAGQVAQVAITGGTTYALLGELVSQDSLPGGSEV